jgi:hypothetical protein
MWLLLAVKRRNAVTYRYQTARLWRRLASWVSLYRITPHLFLRVSVGCRLDPYGSE